MSGSRTNFKIGKNPLSRIQRPKALSCVGVVLQSMIIILLSAAAKGHAQQSLPVVAGVESQPLLAQVRRLDEALEFIGQPFPKDIHNQLLALESSAQGKSVAQGIQQMLDPLCIGTVTVEETGSLKFQPAQTPPHLLENGWRSVLVKIFNRPGLKNILRADSPGARPLPESTKSEVPERWLDLEMYDRRPLNPALSGLALEYRILQIWANKAGERTAPVAFKLAEIGGSPGRVDEVSSKIWSFEKDAEGWASENQCQFSNKTGFLQITSLGDDPFITTPLRMSPGEKIVRVRARPDANSTWQMFWMTEKRREPDGNHVVNFQVNHSTGQMQEYKFGFKSEDHLVGLRLDPGNLPGIEDLESIEISNQEAVGPEWCSAKVNFTIDPSIPVKFKIMDIEGLPAVASFIIRDSQGRVYPMQSKRLEPDFFFQPQIYRMNGETESLPEGVYNVSCSRGPECLPEEQVVNVNAQTHEIHYDVKRWVDPMSRGWYSGDNHIHGAGCLHYTKPTEGVLPESMHRHTMGEDLKIGCSLNWGPGFDYQARFFCGATDQIFRYPYLIHQDVEVSGFGSSESGHLCLLRLTEQIPKFVSSKADWPKLCLSTLRWAKAQGAVCGTAHSSIGLEGSVGRIAGPDGPNGLPSFDIPRYDGIGADEFIMDVTHKVPGLDGTPVPAIDFIATMNTDRRLELNMWYQVLNCGYRTRASGETDFPCLSGARVGTGRVYVKLDGKLNYNDWCEKLRDGRSYVSDGTSHLMDFKASESAATSNSVSVGEQQSELRLKKPGTIRLTAMAAHRQTNTNQVLLEVVINGYPVASKLIRSDGGEQHVEFEVPLKKSSWIALRTFPSAHTNPIFVIVDDKPIRASKRSAEWCLRGVDQCWLQKKHCFSGDERTRASADYDHARQEYQHIISESIDD